MRELTKDLGRSRRLGSLLTGREEGSMRNSDILASIVMESHEQLAFMQFASGFLCDLEISHEVLVLSNYTQEQLVEYTRLAQLRGLKVIIAGGAPVSDFLSVIASNTLLPVLEVAISTPQAGEHPPGSDAGEANTLPNGVGSEVRSSARRAARTAAAIVALNDCHVHERLRIWQESHTRNKDAAAPEQ